MNDHPNSSNRQRGQSSNNVNRQQTPVNTFQNSEKEHIRQKRLSKKGVLTLYIIAAVAVFLSVLTIMILTHHTHQWIDATCIEPRTCGKCGETEGEALGHQWLAATCTAPQTCSVCGATEGEALGHQWLAASCTAPQTCSVCGATEGEALGHQWLAASCTAPQTCSICGATEGEALGHQWDLNDLARGIHYCPVCQHTEPVYINDLPYVGKVGKLWLMGGESLAAADTDIDEAAAYLPNRQDILGYSAEARDSSGNLHQRGLFVDGSVSAEYEVTYYLGGRFSTFSGVYASAQLKDDTLLMQKNNGERKYFQVFLDGSKQPIYISTGISVSDAPIPFNINVSGVVTLQIKYDGGDNPSRMATIFDGELS